MRLPPETDKVLSDLNRAEALAVVGCWAKGTSYPSCDVDILAIGKVSKKTFVKGETRFRILTFNAKDTKSYLPLAGKVTIVKDPKLKLMTLMANKEVWYVPLKKSVTEESIMASLTNVARCEESLSRHRPLAAAFWLMLSVYDYCQGILYHASATPSPSHMLQQIRAVGPGDYPFVASALSLEMSTRLSIARRGRIAYRLKRGRELVRMMTRVEYLVENQRLTEAYFYQGSWLGEGIKSLYMKKCKGLGIQPVYGAIIDELPQLDWKLLGLNVEEVNIRESSMTLALKAKTLLNSVRTTEPERREIYLSQEGKIL